MKPLTVMGLMSGTSMDGVDAAILVTDGEVVAERGPTLFRPYADDERAAIRAALAEARRQTDRTARPEAMAEAERIVTEVHADAVARLMAEAGYVDVIGFHGQTVFHAPERGLTIQLGDGRELAARAGVPVVYDFRAADVAAGGQGAPLVPVYHRALVRAARLDGTTVVVNVGGVANITRVGEEGALVAGDTGPGNALLDDFVRSRTGAAMDEGGRLASSGIPDQAVLDALLADAWFDRPMPKSLDRDAFSAAAVAVAGLSDSDGAATLAAFTARAIALGIGVAGGADRAVVTGGGAENPVLVSMIADVTRLNVIPAAELGWPAAFVEAEAFAFLAARHMARLPLTFPGTTGVAEPTLGGVLAGV